MSHPSPHNPDPLSASSDADRTKARASYDALADGAPIAASRIREGDVLIGRVAGPPMSRAPTSLKMPPAGGLRVGEYHREAVLRVGDMQSDPSPVLVLQQQSARSGRS